MKNFFCFAAFLSLEVEISPLYRWKSGLCCALEMCVMLTPGLKFPPYGRSKLSLACVLCLAVEEIQNSSLTLLTGFSCLQAVLWRDLVFPFGTNRNFVHREPWETF